MFGRGGTGGVLNRVTKKGEISSDFNTYEAGTDQFWCLHVQIDSNTTLNSETAFRLNAYYSELDGDRDFSDGERTGINPTLRHHQRKPQLMSPTSISIIRDLLTVGFQLVLTIALLKV